MYNDRNRPSYNPTLERDYRLRKQKGDITKYEKSLVDQGWTIEKARKVTAGEREALERDALGKPTDSLDLLPQNPQWNNNCERCY